MVSLLVARALIGVVHGCVAPIAWLRTATDKMTGTAPRKMLVRLDLLVDRESLLRILSNKDVNQAQHAANAAKVIEQIDTPNN